MKFTHPAEAAVKVAGGIDKKEKASLNVQPNGEDKVDFIVSDTGIGVPPEEAEHIFEEFVQLDDYYDGTGIGLTLARSIARRLGGDIVLDTTYSPGARFVFTLPLEGKQ
jgi:signal transduction histidine kinase